MCSTLKLASLKSVLKIANGKGELLLWYNKSEEQSRNDSWM